MSKDLLLLLDPQFEDPALGHERAWFCPDCAMVYQALQLNPHWAQAIDIEQIGFVRPRKRVITLVGEDHQSLPLLVFGDPNTAPATSLEANGKRFLQGGREITAALAARYGGVGPHP
ncbi:MAG: DUF3088 family protein [Caulobacterales bacterium]|jgi:hypothetical protein